MIATIAKRFTFDAAHRLSVLPADHKCHRLHGHTYEVELVITGRVMPETGFLIDYADIADAWEIIHNKVDHQYLNDVPGLDIPSTEVLAAWLVEQLVATFRVPPPYPFQLDGAGGATILDHVRVKESTTTWCMVTVEDMYQSGLITLRSWSTMHRLASGKSSLDQHLDDDVARLKYVTIKHGSPCSCRVEMDDDRTVELGKHCTFAEVQ